MAGVQLIFDYLKPEEIEAAVAIETEGGSRVISTFLSHLTSY
jgi:hypothetical protein